VRGRLGYEASPKILLYGTGGMAYGRVDSDLEQLGPVIMPDLPWPGVKETSDTLVGWTIGAGTEYAIHRNWSLRAEYLYIDLGSANIYQWTDELVSLSFDKDVKIHTLRIGLNYHF
jgi:outer membrane immunogenic protein